MKTAVIPPTPGAHAIYDTKDKCWIGNEHGPLCYAERDLARLAATIMNERCYSLTRFRVQPLPADGPWFLKDEITPPLSSEEALQQIEKRI